MTAYFLRGLFVFIATALAWFNLPVSIVAIVAVALVFLQSKASSLVEFSLGPLKAKLECELSDAEKLVEKLRSMTVLQARAAITSGIRTGRWPGNDDVWQFENSKHLEIALREMGTSEDDLRAVRADLVWFTIFDTGHSATGGVTLPMHLSKDACREWSEARDKQDFIDPDKVASWLQKWGQMTPERQVLVDDMVWMQANQDVKDVEQYLRAKRTIEWSK